MKKYWGTTAAAAVAAAAAAEDIFPTYTQRQSSAAVWFGLVWITESSGSNAIMQQLCGSRRDYYDSVGVWSGVIVGLSRDLYSQPMSVSHCVCGGIYNTLTVGQSWLSCSVRITSTCIDTTAVRVLQTPITNKQVGKLGGGFAKRLDGLFTL